MNARPYGLCADIHAHAWTAFAGIDAEGNNTRLVQIMDEFDRCCANAKASGAERVFIAGDLFHVRGNLKTSVLNYVNYRIRKAARLNKVEVVIMPGNHDLENAEITDMGDAAVALEADDEVSIIVCHDFRIFEKEKVALIPWENTRAGLLERVAELQSELRPLENGWSDFDLLLHTGINGVITGMPDHGWAVSELADFGFKRVFAGHYHAYKDFELADDRHVVSIGALTHQTWGDVGTRAGHLIVKGDQFEQHGSAAPKFIDFSDIEEMDDIVGNYVRVRGDDFEESDLTRLRSELVDHGARGVSIQAVPKSKVVTRAASTGKSVRIEQSVSDWIKNAEVDHKKDVEALALSVLSEARSAT